MIFRNLQRSPDNWPGGPGEPGARNHPARSRCRKKPHGKVLTGFLRRHRPGRASARMARSPMSGQSCSTQAHRIAVVNQPLGRNRREQIGYLQKRNLRARRVQLFGHRPSMAPVMRQCFSSTPPARPHDQMRVRIQQDLHIAEFESQRFDVSFNLRRSLRQTAIEQNVSIRRHD